MAEPLDPSPASVALDQLDIEGGGRHRCGCLDVRRLHLAHVKRCHRLGLARPEPTHG
jgi:hypothetical protein